MATVINPDTGKVVIDGVVVEEGTTPKPKPAFEFTGETISQKVARAKYGAGTSFSGTPGIVATQVSPEGEVTVQKAKPKGLITKEIKPKETLRDIQRETALTSLEVLKKKGYAIGEGERGQIIISKRGEETRALTLSDSGILAETKAPVGQKLSTRETFDPSRFSLLSPILTKQREELKQKQIEKAKESKKVYTKGTESIVRLEPREGKTIAKKVSWLELSPEERKSFIPVSLSIGLAKYKGEREEYFKFRPEKDTIKKSRIAKYKAIGEQQTWIKPISEKVYKTGKKIYESKEFTATREGAKAPFLPITMIGKAIKEPAEKRKQYFKELPELSFKETFSSPKSFAYETTRGTGKAVSGIVSEFADKPLLTTAKYYGAYKLLSGLGVASQFGLKATGVSLTRAAQITGGVFIGGFIGGKVIAEPEKFTRPAGYIETGTELGIYGLMFKGIKKYDPFKLKTRTAITAPKKGTKIAIEQYPGRGVATITAPKETITMRQQVRIPFTQKWFTYQKVPFGMETKGVAQIKLLSGRQGTEVGKISYKFTEIIPKRMRGLGIAGKPISYQAEFGFQDISAISTKGISKSMGKYYQIVKTGKDIALSRGDLFTSALESAPRGASIRTRIGDVTITGDKGITSYPFKSELKTISPAGEYWVSRPLSALPTPPEAKWGWLGKETLGLYKGPYGKVSPEIKISRSLMLSKIFGGKKYSETVAHEETHWLDITKFGVTERLAKKGIKAGKKDKDIWLSQPSAIEPIIKRTKLVRELRDVSERYDIMDRYGPSKEDYLSIVKIYGRPKKGEYAEYISRRMTRETIAEFGGEYLTKPMTTKRKYPALSGFFEESLGVKAIKIEPLMKGMSKGMTQITILPETPKKLGIKEVSVFDIAVGTYDINIVGRGRGIASIAGDRMDIRGTVELDISTDFYKTMGIQKTKGTVVSKDKYFFGLTETDTKIDLGRMDISRQLTGIKGTRIDKDTTQAAFFSYEQRGTKQKPLFIGGERKTLFAKYPYRTGKRQVFVSAGAFAGGKPVFRELGKIFPGGLQVKEDVEIGMGSGDLMLSGYGKTGFEGMFYKTMAKQQAKQLALGFTIQIGQSQAYAGAFKQQSLKQFATTQLPSTRVSVIPELSLKTRLSTEQRGRLALKQESRLIGRIKIAQALGLTSTQRIKTIQKLGMSQVLGQKLSQRQAQKQAQRQKLYQKQLQKSFGISTFGIMSTGTTPDPTMPGPPPPPPPPPPGRFDMPYDLIRRRKGKVRQPSKRAFKYTASIQAGQFNIFGKKPKILTGVGIRPLLPGWK